MDESNRSSDHPNFQTTHWSIVLTARRKDDLPAEDWRKALEDLCTTYWFPLYAFLRRKGYAASDAQDLTQSFFAKLIEKDFLKAVDPDRGRFRWFLMDAIKKFAANWNAAQTAEKRGGSQQILSINFDDGESRYSREPADRWTPERLFDRQWAINLLETAIFQLQSDYNANGKQRFFDTLKVFLTDEDKPSYAEVATHLGLSQTAVKVAIHRLRDKYRQTIRQLVAATLDDVDSLDDEIEQLLNAL